MTNEDLKRRVLVLLDEDFTIAEIAERCYDSEAKIRCIIRDEMKARGERIAAMRSKGAVLAIMAAVAIIGVAIIPLALRVLP